jgi:tripartite-type tricarboxylate transporter receptor subunit TctC
VKVPLVIPGPAGLPADIIDKVNRAVAKSLEQPQVLRQLEQDSVQAKVMSPAETTQFVRSEVQKWVPFVRRTLGAN